jgi:hypothetical protein
MRRIAFAALVVASSGCSTVAVSYSSSDRPAPRPAGCHVLFFRMKVPDRPFVELATLSFSAVHRSSAQKVNDKVRAKACAIGADALLITQDYQVEESFTDTPQGGRTSTGRSSSMKATAIRWRDRTSEAAADADGLVPSVKATTVGATPLRSAPDASANVLQILDGGTVLLAAPRGQEGFRLVRVPRGASGYVEEASLNLPSP